jgi:hypothetical protein
MTAPGMLMPEAIVDKDQASVARKDNVGSSREILAVHPETKPFGV